jgi:hypothetical protein
MEKSGHHGTALATTLFCGGWVALIAASIWRPAQILGGFAIVIAGALVATNGGGAGVGTLSGYQVWARRWLQRDVALAPGWYRFFGVLEMAIGGGFVMAGLVAR